MFNVKKIFMNFGVVIFASMMLSACEPTDKPNLPPITPSEYESEVVIEEVPMNRRNGFNYNDTVLCHSTLSPALSFTYIKFNRKDFRLPEYDISISVLTDVKGVQWTLNDMEWENYSCIKVVPTTSP